MQVQAACCRRHQQLQQSYLQAEAAVLAATAAALGAPNAAPCRSASDAALLISHAGSASEALAIAKRTFLLRLGQSKMAAAAEAAGADDIAEAAASMAADDLNDAAGL